MHLGLEIVYVQYNAASSEQQEIVSRPFRTNSRYIRTNSRYIRTNSLYISITIIMIIVIMGSATLQISELTADKAISCAQCLLQTRLLTGVNVLRQPFVRLQETLCWALGRHATLYWGRRS